MESTHAREVSEQKKPIIFYDGFCGLCDGFVRFTVAQDKQGIFLFAPIQGETAKGILSPEEIARVESIVLWDQQQTYRKSEAALRIMTRLPGIWKLARIWFLVPRIIRDWVYELVAKYRYQIFGKKAECTIPTPHQRERFLD